MSTNREGATPVILYFNTLQIWLEYYWGNSLCMTYCPPPQDCPRSVLALEHSPKWKLGAELSPDPDYSQKETSFLKDSPLPWINHELIVLFKYMCHMASGLPYQYICSLHSHQQEGNGVFTCSTRGMCTIHHPASVIRRDPLAMGDWHTLQMMIRCLLSFP